MAKIETSKKIALTSEDRLQNTDARDLGAKVSAIASTKNVKHSVVPVEESSESNEKESGISQWLGLTSLPVPKIVTAFDIVQLSHSGITKASVDELAGRIGISRKSLAEDILAVSVKTIERKGATEKLDKRTSSHVVEIARILQQAYGVFEDEEKVKRWLNKENRALNNQKPVQFFDTLTGLNMVSNVLGRIEEGVYS